MKKKSSTSKVKKGPLGTPLGNPLGYFRQESTKRQAALKKGGYNVPKNMISRKQEGGEGTTGTTTPPEKSQLAFGVPLGKNVVVGATSDLSKDGLSNTNAGIMYNNQKGTSGSIGYNVDKNQVSGQGTMGKWSGNANYDIDDKTINANVSRKIGDNWNVGVGYSGDVSNPSLNNVNVNATGKVLGVPVKISAGGNQGLKFGAQRKGGAIKNKATKKQYGGLLRTRKK